MAIELAVRQPNVIICALLPLVLYLQHEHPHYALGALIARRVHLQLHSAVYILLGATLFANTSHGRRIMFTARGAQSHVFRILK